MPTKISSCRHALQKKSDNLLWDKAHRWVRERVRPQEFATYLVHVELGGGKPRRIPKRLLASRRGVTEKTIFNHNRALAKAGVLRFLIHKIGRRRNAPNTYILLDRDGRDLHLSREKIFHEKPVQISKPTTPPRAARVENHPPAMRRLFEQNGRIWKLLRRVTDAKAHRLRRAEERTRRASEANLGRWNGVFVPVDVELQAELDKYKGVSRGQGSHRE